MPAGFTIENNDKESIVSCHTDLESVLSVTLVQVPKALTLTSIDTGAELQLA